MKRKNKQTKQQKNPKTPFLISFQLKKNYARFITETYICSGSSYRRVKRREIEK